MISPVAELSEIPKSSLHLMHGTELLNIFFALILVALNGFFVGAEFAFVKIRETRLKEMAEGGSFLAKLALREHTHLDVYLSATQIGVTLASLGLGWIGEPAFAHLVEPVFARWHGPGEAFSHVVGTIVAFSIITYLHILFGELIPKTASILKAERIALFVALPLHLFFLLFYPIIWVLNRSLHVALRVLHLPRVGEHVTFHTEEEIRLILAESARGGSLKDSEVLLVERSFEFADIPVHAVMIPRVDIDFLSIEWDTERVLQEVMEHPHSRYTIVQGEDVDQVMGFIHLQELVPQIAARDIHLHKILRPMHMVPETQSIERVLRDLQMRRSQIALALDEYGGTAGLVTMDDLVGELVGEVTDEMNREPPEIQREEDRFIIQGAASITDVSRVLGEELESDHFDTLGGWIMGTLERIPREGDHVESEHFCFQVRKMDNARVLEVEAHPRHAKSPDGETGETERIPADDEDGPSLPRL